MSTRSLNKVQLIGNLTRDPELRYTPAGTAVCSLGIATNRSWTTESGEKKEDVEFHRVVAWSKLAELCAQLLFKGRKVYVEGRLQTRSWQGQDGNQRSTTEVVIDDMLVLDNRQRDGQDGGDQGGSQGGNYGGDDEYVDDYIDSQGSSNAASSSSGNDAGDTGDNDDLPF